MTTPKNTIAVAAIALCLGALWPGAGLVRAPQAEEIDWKKGKLERLAPTIGTYRHGEVLADPDVQAALAALLPPAALAAMALNLTVAAPIDFIDGHLILSGNRPHHGDEDTASVWIKIYDGAVRVILQQGGKTTLYAREEMFQHLPLGLRAALATPPAATPWEAPPELTWVR